MHSYTYYYICLSGNDRASPALIKQIGSYVITYDAPMDTEFILCITQGKWQFGRTFHKFILLILIDIKYK